MRDLPATPAQPAGALLAAADLQDHLLTATHDLDRLQQLLRDASDTLLQRFQRATDQLREIQSQMAPDAPARAGLDVAIRQLRGAVTALQFEDLASQLIAHTQRRLRSCADRIAGDAMSDDADGSAVMEAAPLRPNPVTQGEMDTGLIELF